MSGRVLTAIGWSGEWPTFPKSFLELCITAATAAFGQTLFVVWVSLWAERPGVRVYDFRFEPPWPDRDFRVLPTFADSHFADQYALPGGLEFAREDVLNLNLGKSGWRLPSTRAEGVLCALSGTPIPKKYKHGASIGHS